MPDLPQPRIAWSDDEEDLSVPTPKATDRAQGEVLIEALEIFLERNAKRADLWKQFGWQDSALHLRSKALRIALALEKDLDIDPEDVLDDAIDIINYAVFFVRNVRGD
jgi:hypothetical protein